MSQAGLFQWNPQLNHQWNLSAWWLLITAVPVLLVGELLVTHIKPLAKLDLPAPIVGGLIIALLVLLINISGIARLTLNNKVSARAWTWIITPETQLAKAPALPVYLPLSTAFFCCVGLNASWAVAKKGSWQLLLLLALATLLGVLQNLLGVFLCHGLHQNPLLGLICGSVTLTGGPSTALGFADTFQKAGFAAADVVGAAAAMFGIVAASLLAGAFGGQLVRRLKLQKSAASTTAVRRTRSGLFSNLNSLAGMGPTLAGHLVILLICMKLGAWLSLAMSLVHIQLPRHWGVLQITLPVYMGAMILAVIVRNVTDQFRKPLVSTAVVQTIASVFLSLFLVMAMTSLNLLQLRNLALPMLAILGAQVVLMLIFALAVTYVFMGRDYDAAVMSAGHVGFGLGITPNAVATMDVLEQKFGIAPRAVLIVTVVGAFLIDFTNSVIITLHLSFLH
jgi:ESS family glutamate:Na+ symporter